VEGNYFFGNNVEGTGGIRIIGEGHKVINNYIADTEGEDAFSAISFMSGVLNSPLNRYFQVKDALVAFNTLVNNKNSFEIGVGKNEELSLPPVNSVIANNIVFSTKRKLVTETAVPVDFRWEGNIFYGADPGMKLNEGVRIIDPRLEKGSDGIWRPSASSPALRSAAGKYECVQRDILGRIRTEPKDIGCEQASDGHLISGPVNKNETGPRWDIHGL
jgi:poly(beta-D-mannuronate) lyase